MRLTRGSGRTLQTQLGDRLRAAIATLPPGTRLPSTRALAQQLHLSRNTVMNVYEELAAMGLVTSRTGSGTRVSGAVPKPAKLNARRLLRAAKYPARAVPLVDPDGHAVYLHV